MLNWVHNVNRTDYPSGFKKILPAAYKFWPAVHRNLGCGPNSPPRTSQEASSRNLVDFNRKRSREALLSFTEKQFYWQPPSGPSAWPWRWRSNKKTESLSDVCMCEVSTPQSPRAQISLFSQIHQSTRCGAVTTIVGQERDNWCVLKHLFLEGVNKR